MVRRASLGSYFLAWGRYWSWADETRLMKTAEELKKQKT